MKTKLVYFCPKFANVFEKCILFVMGDQNSTSFCYLGVCFASRVGICEKPQIKNVKKMRASCLSLSKICVLALFNLVYARLPVFRRKNLLLSNKSAPVGILGTIARNPVYKFISLKIFLADRHLESVPVYWCAASPRCIRNFPVPLPLLRKRRSSGLCMFSTCWSWCITDSSLTKLRFG